MTINNINSISHFRSNADTVDDHDTSPSWTIPEVVAEKENIDSQLSQTICDLFEQDFTIPFLCRYRKNLINYLEPERLRGIKETIDEVKVVQTKLTKLLKNLSDSSLLTDDIARSIKSVKSLDEVEQLVDFYKPPRKGTLFERAQKLGLEEPAIDILDGKSKFVNVQQLVDPKVEGLATVDEAKEGIVNIISHLLVKNEDVMGKVRDLKDRYPVTITAKMSTNKKVDDESKEKFANYFNFCKRSTDIEPYQTLAIYRGVALNALTMKFELHQRIQSELQRFVDQNFSKGSRYDLRTELIQSAFDNSFKKKITPFITGQASTSIKRLAEKRSIEVFAANLKNLLLQQPVKGCKILGIDPGFKSGCKIAMISEKGELLRTNAAFNLNNFNEASRIVGEIMKNFDCTKIAIGNGTASRETESLISELVKKQHLNAEYCIVSEQGASIYSCSKTADEEFSSIDVQYRGAISIARRLQDPLCELVKIDAKHIGVGMYQHDVNEAALKKSLDEVVSECVSFVGIDLNTASLSLLKSIAGLGEKRAEKILEYRAKHGSFKTRHELLKVPTIGQKTFTQCAGFTRVLNGSEPLDATNVHPDDYNLAKAIIKDCKLDIKNVGSQDFVAKFVRLQTTLKIDDLAKKHKCQIDSVHATIDALSKRLLHDYRTETKIEPIFKKGMTSLSSLKIGQSVNGVVMNVVDFGAFVDIGVGTNGLIHKSKLGNAKLKASDKVECKIVSIEAGTKAKIGLQMMNLLLS